MKGIKHDLPQAGINAQYTIKGKGIEVTIHLCVPRVLGEVVLFHSVELSETLLLKKKGNQWFIVGNKLYTWSEIEDRGVYNLYYDLMDEARKVKRHLMEYHKETILQELWNKLQK